MKNLPLKEADSPKGKDTCLKDSLPRPAPKRGRDCGRRSVQADRSIIDPPLTKEHVMRCAAFNTGGEFQTLDHIAPLAELIGMPLITTEKRNQELLAHYYPQVEVRFMPNLENELGAIAEEFDALFECKYWHPELKLLFQNLYNKEMRLIFCPHGQSDKGYQAPVLAPYATQEIVLLYGELLVDMLKELAIFPKLKRYTLVGNYRLKFYQKHRAFYAALVARQLSFDQRGPTVLYAPTWRDVDQATSFFTYGKKVIEELPDDWNLIIKPHPFLEQRAPAHYYALAALAEKRPNICLLEECPLVYPILAHADLFLGDTSSVGYDALFFQLPLYFFPTPHLGRLHACGRVVDPEKNLYSQLSVDKSFQENQKNLYNYTFGPEREEDILRNQIKQLINVEY